MRSNPERKYQHELVAARPLDAPSRITCHRLRWLLILALLCGAAFVLRVVRLDAVPLRGDEAFTVTYWAAAPGDVIEDLAHWEPHPFGAFFGFWAWKGAAGDSPFAMRYLPALSGMIGTASVAVLARRLFRDDWLAIIAAGLWAANPFLIWHAQDVRNYALWAAISPLSMWLFLRAVEVRRPRAWVVYLLAECLAVYLFFLESFLLIVQAVYLLIMRPPRAVWRQVITTWAVLGSLMIPWFVQLVWLVDSGYTGTREQADPVRLLTWFLPTLLTGSASDGRWPALVPLAGIGIAVYALVVRRRSESRRLLWLAAWIALPTALLFVIAERMSVFDPRYLIAITPALLMLLAWMLRPPTRLQRPAAAYWIPLAALMLLITLPGGRTLVRHYRGDDPKAPSWPALVAYLDQRARPGDVIVQAHADPAFTYYYRGPVAEGSLENGPSAADQLADELDRWNTFWLIGRAPDAESFLSQHRQTLTVHNFDGFSVLQYAPPQVVPGEIAAPQSITFGTFARLAGYTVQGPTGAVPVITALLYWEPLAQTSTGYKVFVHLLGPTNPATGGPLWDQDDHTPLYGTISTQSWDVGTRFRDVYHVLDDPDLGLVPGGYMVRIGLYDPTTGERVPATGPDGTPLGDGVTILSFTWPLPE